MSNCSTNRPGFYGKGSVEISPGSKGEGGIRRLAITADKLVESPAEGIATAHDILKHAARVHGDKPGLGWRDVLNIVEEEKDVEKVVEGKTVTEKKKWKYFQLSEYKFLSYVQTDEAVSEIARGLVELGVTSDDVFNVYAATSVNWQLMNHACVSISVPVATAYDTLGESGLAHSLNEPSCIGLFTNAELLTTVLHVLPNVPSIKYVVFDGKPSQDVVSKIKAVRESISVYSIDDLRTLGRDKPTEPLEALKPKPETLACIMYTSGSTGNPKGVCITNANLVASVGAVKALLGHHFVETDSFLAYLPLAHILEYIVELCFVFVGMKTGYGRVKTLTDQSVRNCLGDLREFKPSIMVGVPAVWETIRKGILTKVHAGGTLKKSAFNTALAVKRAGVPGLSQLADAAVMNKIKDATGGRLRLALSGGAALSRASQEFLNLSLTTLVQGYGMTESCGMCAILPPELVQYGPVGLPVPAIEVKLKDVEEAGYLSSNNPPQGEVCIRGPAVIKQYYKRPDLNNDESIFTKDGWLRTGDVGQWNKDGTLSLIDRIKNLVKLQGGEYIALERLESAYRSCNLVANICVHATQDAKQPMAIIIPHEPHLRSTLTTLGKNKENASLEELCKDKEVRDLILKECNAVGKKNAFKPMELLQAVILTSEEWTPENGLVTAAQKIQRSKIAKAFEQPISEIYKNQ